MSPRSYEVVSGDTHLELSPFLLDQWRSHVDKEFHEFMPKIVKLKTGGDGWLVHGNPDPMPLALNYTAGIPFDEVELVGLSYDNVKAGGREAEEHLKEMDLDGVDAQILYPAAGVRYTDLPREAQIGLARGYNDWISEEYCAADYDRLFGLAVVPNTTVEDALEELRRVAGKPGIRGVVLWQWPNGSGHPEPEDDQFWAATLELGLPLSAHISFGAGMLEDPRKAPSAANMMPINALLARGGGPTYAPVQLMTEGVFDRFPELRIFLAETYAGWIPHWMCQSDDHYRRHHHWADLELRHDPSWYIRRHFLWNIMWDLEAMRQRHAIGVENLTWGDDFPHSASDWPNSRWLLEEHLKDVPEDEARKIKAENLLDFLKIDYVK